jgi:hypothetical protein
VSAASFGCHWDNRWCNEDNEPPLADNEQLSWKAGEPFNVSSKECVAADFTREKAPHLTFFKTECNNKFLAIFESRIKFDN